MEYIECMRNSKYRVCGENMRREYVERARGESRVSGDTDTEYVERANRENIESMWRYRYKVCGESMLRKHRDYVDMQIQSMWRAHRVQRVCGKSM